MLSQFPLIPDYQDKRDYLYTDFDWRDKLPDEVDLREFVGVIEDQQSVGSCTANATCKAAEMFAIAAGQKDTEATDDLDLSRLFNYYTSRSYLPAEYQASDKGSTLRCALSAAKNFGISQESIWPYDTAYWNTKPNVAAYADAEDRKAGAYFRISGKTPDCLRFYSVPELCYMVRHALASGYPVILGANVNESLRTYKAGDIYQPCSTTIPGRAVIGGHAMLIVGYKSVTTQEGRTGCFIVANSWGKQWGDNGFFLMAAEVIPADMIDMWVLQGFAGVEKVGEDKVERYVEPITPPEPTPTPEPVQPPKPPTPQPVEPPKPSPPITPQPEKPKDKGITNLMPLWLGVAIIVAWAVYSLHKSGVL